MKFSIQPVTEAVNPTPSIPTQNQEGPETRLYRVPITRNVYYDESGYVEVEAVSEEDARERILAFDWNELEHACEWDGDPSYSDSGDADFENIYWNEIEEV